MLPTMPESLAPTRRRRVPPLAIAFALMAAALVATTWSTRDAVVDASEALHEGNVYAVQQAVRADLGELDGAPSEADLAKILQDHADQGLRYVAMVDGHGQVLDEAGTPVGDTQRHGHRGPAVTRLRGRTRVELGLGGRHGWAGRGRALRVAMEIEPVQATRIRGAATRTLGIGALAALTLLGVAIALVRRELRRRAEDSARERERRLASLGEMSAVLAHEIKNPLASLKGNAQLLAAMLPKTDDPPGAKLRAKADRVVDEAIRLEKLTIDLLAFVRTGELARAPVAPGPLVRGAAETLTNGAQIEIDDAAAPPAWSLDEGRVREVVVNLMDNALAAGPPVRARVAAEGGRLVIEISDHGPGVPEADRERVFEPFFTGKTRGTGLGLAIARRIVEQHGGTIAIDDAEGGGARFRIEIPETPED